MRSIFTLTVFASAALSNVLGAICNGKGLCMSLERSQDDHFFMNCNFNGNTDSIEWKVSAPGLSPSNADHYANLRDNGELYFDWGAAHDSDSRTAARVICISKADGWNQVEAQLRRGGRELL